MHFVKTLQQFKKIYMPSLAQNIHQLHGFTKVDLIFLSHMYYLVPNIIMKSEFLLKNCLKHSFHSDQRHKFISQFSKWHVKLLKYAWPCQVKYTHDWKKKKKSAFKMLSWNWKPISLMSFMHLNFVSIYLL